MENKSCAAYAQDLVIRVTGYGILGYHDDVPLSVWNKKFEITNGTHNFVTLIKMTKELKTQDTVNYDNATRQKCLMIKLKLLIFIVITFHIIIVRFVSSGANVLISNSAHFSFKTWTGHIAFGISGIYNIHFKDGYKGPACNINMNLGSVNPYINVSITLV